MVYREKIGVVGLWHLGCVLTAAWSKLGFSTIGFDPELDLIAQLQGGKAPLYEPNLDNELLESIENKNLSFSADPKSLSNCDYVFLTYDTPVNEKDESDTSILLKTIVNIKKHLKDGCIVIVSSQSPVGFCSVLRDILKEENQSLDLAYSPENLRLGEAIDCYLKPGRIILGANSQATINQVKNLFYSITENIITMSLESSELVKHGINSYLAMSIVYTNHLADICEMTGGQITDVVKGLKSDPRIGEYAYLNPGIGFSGGTLGRDLKVLDDKNDIGHGKADLFGYIHSSNSLRKFEIVYKIKKLLGMTLVERKIGILGLTYKPNTSTLRRSLPLEIVDLLIEESANVSVFDPKADYNELSTSPKFTICHSIEEVLSNVEIAVLLTEWQEFKTIDWTSSAFQNLDLILFDTKNIYRPSQFVDSKIRLINIGS